MDGKHRRPGSNAPTNTAENHSVHVSIYKTIFLFKSYKLMPADGRID